MNTFSSRLCLTWLMAASLTLPINAVAEEEVATTPAVKPNPAPTTAPVSKPAPSKPTTPAATANNANTQNTNATPKPNTAATKPTSTTTTTAPSATMSNNIVAPPNPNTIVEERKQQDLLANAQRIDKVNRELLAKNQEMQVQLENLTLQNSMLKRDHASDGFWKGAGAIMLGFFMGWFLAGGGRRKTNW